MKAIFATILLSAVTIGCSNSEDNQSSALASRVEFDRTQPTIDIFEFKRSAPEGFYYSKNPYPVREFNRTGRSFKVFFQRPVGRDADLCRPLELVSCFENHSAAVFLRHGTCYGNSEFKESLGYVCERPSAIAPQRSRLDLYTYKENYLNTGWWRNVYIVSGHGLGAPWQHKYLLGYLPR